MEATYVLWESLHRRTEITNKHSSSGRLLNTVPICWIACTQPSNKPVVIHSWMLDTRIMVTEWFDYHSRVTVLNRKKKKDFFC